MDTFRNVLNPYSCIFDSWKRSLEIIRVNSLIRSDCLCPFDVDFPGLGCCRLLVCFCEGATTDFLTGLCCWSCCCCRGGCCCRCGACVWWTEDGLVIILGGEVCCLGTWTCWCCCCGTFCCSWPELKLWWFTPSLTRTINTFQKIVEEGIIKRVARWWTLMILLRTMIIVLAPLSALWRGRGPVQVIVIHRVIIIVNHLVIIIESRWGRILPLSWTFYRVP